MSTAALTNGKASGRAIVYDSPSQVLAGSFVEIIAAGALTGVDLSQVKLLSGHDSSQALASVDSGTLRLTNRRDGLYMEADLPASPAGENMRVALASGVLNRMSFAFGMSGGVEHWYQDTITAMPTRVIERFGHITELSVVAWPAYTATSASGRALDLDPAWLKEARRRYGLTERRDEGPIVWGSIPGMIPIRRPAELVRRSAEVRDLEMGERELAIAEAANELAAMHLSLPPRRRKDAADILAQSSWSLPCWAAYRSLARSRGVTTEVVALAAMRGDLGSIIELPVVEVDDV